MAAGLFCFLLLPVSLPGLARCDQTVRAEETEETSYSPPLEATISANAAVVVDTGRLRQLYAKNAGMRMNIPAAAKVMTALIACERLPLDTQVTISTVAAEASDREDTGDGVNLMTGDKYSLEYLLMRMIYYNSDAAALAVAEQISSVEEKFVELMNTKAAGYELADTYFLNCTGRPVFPEPTETDDTDGKNGIVPVQPASLQYTTVLDLARLVSFAMLDPYFAGILRKESDYLVLGDGGLVSMSNDFQSIWTRSEGQVTGALYCETQNQSHIVAIGKVKEISLILVVAAGNPNQRSTDVMNLISACADNYVQTPLVEAGESFTGAKEKTVDGEVFGLVYKKTVLYIRPVNDRFLKDSIRYNSFGPFSRPIEKSLTAGQVIFELMDGTIIAADVGPDRQILSSITLLNQALNVLQGNRNLFFILLAASGILLLLLFIRVVNRLTRLIRLTQLIILEKRSRR